MHKTMNNAGKSAYYEKTIAYYTKWTYNYAKTGAGMIFVPLNNRKG